MRWWLDWLGAFAVDREKLGVSTIKTVKILRKQDGYSASFHREQDRKPENSAT